MRSIETANNHYLFETGIRKNTQYFKVVIDFNENKNRIFKKIFLFSANICWMV